MFPGNFIGGGEDCGIIEGYPSFVLRLVRMIIESCFAFENYGGWQLFIFF